MNYQEALDFLYESCPTWDYINDCDVSDEFYEQIQLSKVKLQELIYKQTPKKVIYEMPDLKDPKGLRVCICPNCETKMGFQNLELDVERANYCYKCGQALEWGKL